MSDLLQKLEQYGQTHLLEGLDRADDAKKAEFIKALENIDFAFLTDLYRRAITPPAIAGSVTPAAADDLSLFSPAEREARLSAGMAKIAAGKVAAVTMAGGQGTRLGSDAPKGCFDIGIEKSLFELQSERLLRLSRGIRWYIMTSEINYGDTVAFFEKHGFFGYDPSLITFFRQGMLPMISLDGKLLKRSVSELATGPDGNGGVCAALKKSGALADMHSGGIEWVFICGIDNALCRMCDPLFLGHTMLSGARAGSKSVIKRSPEERAGVFCLIDGRPGVIEYFEMPPSLRSATNAEGGLLYGDANIVAHFLQRDALDEICEKGLPYHAALKKEAYAAPDGTVIVPEQPNAYKFETFLFDAFRFLEKMVILRCERSLEFAPVKNLCGEDSPATALALLKNAEKPQSR